MWQGPTVELALFSWAKWRRSLICSWSALRETVLSPNEAMAMEMARESLRRMDIAESEWIIDYWVCCLGSDFNIDHVVSSGGIVVPVWALEGSTLRIRRETLSYP